MNLAAVTAGETARIYHIWPVILPLIPLAGGILVFALGRLSKRIYPLLSFLVTLVTLLSTAGLYPLVKQGDLYCQLPKFMAVGLSFRVDLLGFIFALLVSLAWCVVTLFSLPYMRQEKYSLTYFVFLLFTLAGNLGVMVTGDWVTFFLFFELMTVASYVLVIQNRTDEAMHAGMYTLVLGIAGGLVLLGGVFLLHSLAGHVQISPMMLALQGVPAWSLATILICFMVGFGIKAGMIPLHVWMPRAYGASPAIVNAFSSGAMVKAGIYGIIRIVLLVFTPADMAAKEAFHFAASAGYVIIWLGLITMVFGALMALLQNHAMRLLSYSSISQMGYIIVAIGSAAYLFGLEEAMGFSGAVFHAINHTLYKVSFFLIFAIIFYHTGEYRLDRLGGLWRKFPLLMVFFLLSFGAISGLPLLNGYASKTLIHDALLEAHHYYHTFDIYLAERLFVLGSAFTFCYYAKLFYCTFLGPLPEKYNVNYHTSFLMYLPLALLAAGIILLGIWPNIFIENYLLPAASQFQFYRGGIEHLTGFHFFSEAPLNASATIFLLAVLLALIGFRFRFFWWKPPANLSVEKIVLQPVVSFLYRMLTHLGPETDNAINSFYYKIASDFLALCRVVGQMDSSLDSFYENSSRKAYQIVEKSRNLEDSLVDAYDRSSKGAYQLIERGQLVDESLNEAYDLSSMKAYRLMEKSRQLDESLNSAYESSGRAAKNIYDKTAKMDNALNMAYERSGKAAKELIVPGKDSTQTSKRKSKVSSSFKINPMEWNIKNLNFDTLLLAIMLGIVFFVLFFFR